MIGLETTTLVARELKETHLHEKVRAHISTLYRSKETHFTMDTKVLYQWLLGFEF